jgi:PAS domain S-box-containing protein
MLETAVVGADRRRRLGADRIRRLFGIGVAVSIAYVLAARLGFHFAVVAEQITTVWAPSGIGIAALLLWGRALWPAIWAGAFAANAFTDAPLWTAGAVATGNTLEAVVAAWALRRGARFDERLQRLRDVIAFVVVAVSSPMVSATIGVATLCAASAQSWTRFGELWGNWWLGDAVGALIVAPAILTAATHRRWRRRRPVEAALLLLLTVVATHAVFGQALGASIGHPLEYVVFPFVITAAMRHGQPATAVVVLVASAVTIWNTVRGAGPFAGVEPHENLILLQVFMGVLAGTGLLLAAAIAERETSERRRAAAHAVGDVLSDAPDLAPAAPAVLRAIGENLEWPIAGLWLLDARHRVLRCTAVWHDRATPATAFIDTTKATAFAPGIGLPGRVWSTGKPVWISDVVEDTNFPRAAAARASGLHGGFGFPIRLGDEVLGVIECFHQTVVPLDADLLRTMSTVGNQVGQFIGRRREAIALRDEQRRTAAIVDTALDAVIGMDHQGIITEFNPAAVRTFGYPREVAIGRELAELLIPPSLRDRHREGLARYLRTGEGGFINRRVEATGQHADGHEFPLEIAIARVADDEPPRFTGFVRDLTAQKQAEGEREQLLTREATARRDAEAANRAKDEFLATLSHELRTPLNAIVGWTRMLLDDTMDRGSARRALEVIDRNAHLQAQLVGDLLDVSRIITGGLRLDLRPLDLAAVIGAALDAVRPAAEAKKVQLRLRLAASGPVVLGDPPRLQQVMWNLLANAVKFTRSGGTVTIDLLDRGRSTVVRVQDDGVGIDPEFLPFVFERFRQADGSASRQHGGLGLGLAIVRHLVELHGGTVRAESDGPDRGATFSVELPAFETAVLAPPIEARAPAPAAADRAAGGELAGYRLLVVDDQEDARELIATIVRSAGADVETAPSAAEALQKMDVSEPDAILADIGMPGADGYELIREVRARDAGRSRRLPVAAITAYAGEEHRNRALEAGFDCHVPKPVSRPAVITAVLAICRSGSRATQA